ncbi:MAG: von Willebrand factor type A domain-containing protein [Lachnospiraceae bacterium]|nr:von Willebrand factor type A domain-containing protein [Lachnospiraceae bacterium]
MLAGCGKNTTSKADAVTADIHETTAQAAREEAFDQEESLPDAAEAATEFDSAQNFKGGTNASFAFSAGSSAASAASSASKANGGYRDYDFGEYEYNTEEYNEITENGFNDVLTNPLSTFAADVDTGSYSNFRRMINDGYDLYDIPADAVRVEEMLNYFDY